VLLNFAKFGARFYAGTVGNEDGVHIGEVGVEAVAAFRFALAAGGVSPKK